MQKGRKVRADKKVDVKPTLPVAIKLSIRDLAKLVNRPVKDVSESICKNAIKYEPFITYLSNYFRREYIYETSMKIGRPEREKIYVDYKGACEKITIKFKQPDYDRLCSLAYALDISPTSTASLLLRMAYYNRLLTELSK